MGNNPDECNFSHITIKKFGIILMIYHAQVRDYNENLKKN